MPNPFYRYRVSDSYVENTWMQLKPPYDCSRNGILSLIYDEYPGVRQAWVNEYVGSFGVHVVFKWWAWLIPLYRWYKRRRLTARIKSLTPAGTSFLGLHDQHAK